MTEQRRSLRELLDRPARPHPLFQILCGGARVDLGLSARLVEAQLGGQTPAIDEDGDLVTRHRQEPRAREAPGRGLVLTERGGRPRRDDDRDPRIRVQHRREGRAAPFPADVRPCFIQAVDEEQRTAALERSFHEPGLGAGGDDLLRGRRGFLKCPHRHDERNRCRSRPWVEVVSSSRAARVAR